MISFVIPIYNEDEGFMPFYDKLLLPVLKKIKYDYEIILVNDGSRDGSLEMIQKLAQKDKRVKVLSFSRNFGKEVALTAGIREAVGDAVITIDADGEHPTKLIPEFIKRWEDGAEIVTGVRKQYGKHGFIAKLGSKLFYCIMGWMGVKEMMPGSTDFRLLDRCVVDEYDKLTEHGRITRGLIDWLGFKKEHIEYYAENRLAGKPSYSFQKLFHLAIDSFISLSTTPLIIFAWLGGFITLVALVIGLFVLIEQVLLGDPLGLNWTGAACLSVFITFLIGLVMVSQSVTALYVSAIHAETQNRPLYIIDKKNSRNLNEQQKQK